MLSTGTNACCSERHPDDKGKVSRCGTSVPRTVGSLFVVKRDHYYSRYILISARSRHNLRQVSIFETVDVEKCTRSSLSLSRTNIDVIFVCSRVPKCKTEIVTVSISDSASAQFARSRGYFFHFKLVACYDTENDYLRYEKLIFLLAKIRRINNGYINRAGYINWVIKGPNVIRTIYYLPYEFTQCY